MIMNMNEKGRQTKLLTAIAVLAMVVCAFAMVVPSDVNGEVTGDGTTATITEAEDFTKVLDSESDYTTIKLGNDITADVNVPANKKVTLDLNGYKLTNDTDNTITVAAGAELTIVDSSEKKTGTIDNITHAKAAIYNSGKVILNGGTIERSLENGAIVWNEETQNYDDDGAKSTNTFYTIQNLGTLDINNGAVVKNNGDMSSVIVNGQSSTTTSGTMNVTGGKIIGGKYVKNEYGTMTISGGEFIDGRCAAIASYGTLKITGGNFDNGTRGSLYILGGSLEITGGSFSSTKSDDVHADVTYKGTVFAWANTISKIAISGMAQYNSNSVLFIEAESTVTDLSIDLNGNILKTTNLKAGENGITISQGSVVISGSIDATNEVTITATGEVKLNGADVTGAGGLKVSTVNDGNNKVIIQDLELASNSKLTIKKGANVEVPENGTLVAPNAAIANAGTLSLYAPITDAQGEPSTITINNTGTLAVAPGVEQPETEGEGGTIVSTTAISDSLGLNQNLDTDLIIKSSAFLEKELTIQSGVTLTIGANATLDLNGCNLIVNGSIVIMNNGSIVSGIDGGAIVLGKSGSIENNGGVIGKGGAIDIKLTTSQTGDRDQYNTGYISVQDVSGIGIVIDKKVDGQKVNYTLALTGDISKKGNVTGTVTVKNASTGDKVYVDGTLEVGNGTVLAIAQSATLELKKGATLDVASKGAINYPASTAAAVGTIILNENSTVNMDGTVTGAFQAPTGKYLTNGEDKATYTTKVSVTNVTGLTITATSTTAYDADEENTVTEVRLVLSGSVEQGSFKTSEEGKETAVNTTVDVSAAGTPNDDVASYAGIFVEDTLFIDEKITSFTLSSTSVQTVMTVLGTVTYDDGKYTPNATNTIGVQYTVESEDADGKKTTTYYIKPFAAAFADIAKADDMTLNVYGPVEVASEITVGADQTISGWDFTITADGKITVAESGTMDVTSMDVQGILVVTADGSFTFTGEFNYSTMTENEETGDVTYAGFAVALANAKPGDVIEISKETKVSSSFTIPAEVTVRVTADGSIVPAEDKTVNMTVNGTLENEGTIQINGNTTVNGVVDLTEGGSATLCGTADKAITVTGEVIANSTIADKINAVWYTNDDGQVVYTTLAKAVTAISAMDVSVEITQVGNVSDSAAVELGDITLNITGTAVFGDIALEKGTVKVTGDGVLTATITGPVGDEGSTVDSAIQLSKVSNATVTNGSTPNSQNVQVWYLNFDTTASDDAIDGTVTVSAGTVQIVGTTVVDGKDNTLTVANGATAVIPAGQDNVLTAGAYDGKAVVTVAGTMTVNGTLNVTGIMDVTGTLTVATSEGAEAAVVNVDDGVNNDADNNATLNILGTLTIVENEDENKAVVNVSGILVIGDKPTVLGAGGVLAGPVETIDAGYVKAYAGADLTGAKIDWNNQSAESEAESSVFYINGYEYMAVYTSVTVTFQNVLDDEVFQLTGYEMVVPGVTTTDDVYNINMAKFWKADADLTEPLETAIGSSDAYTKANASVVPVTVSVGTGISLYIDGIKYESGSTPNLAVGTHTITATVDPGYTGTVTVQFNGQAVTGSFTITPEMASAAYEGTVSVSATGTIAVDGGSPSGSASSDDGMGLTDYLLIILVILIVVMAIIVAMRLMRS